MTRKVPKPTFVRNLRYGLHDLNKLQVKDFLETATDITLAIDDTPSPDGQQSFTAAGAFDQNGRFMCLGLAETNSKTGEGISETTKKILVDAGCMELVKEKIRTDGFGIMSDTCRAQKKANRLLMGCFTGEEKDESGISCLMHLVSNAEKYAFSELPEGSQNVLHSVKLLLGSRYMSGYHKTSIKPVFNALLQKPKAAIFKTDQGSRYGVNSGNARAMLIHKSVILEAIDRSSNGGTHAQAVKNALETQWLKLAMTLACLAFFYFGVLSPFHSLVSKTVPWAVVKETIQLTREKLVSLKESDVDPFEVFQTAIAREEDISGQTKESWAIAQDLYKDYDQKSFVKGLCARMAGRVLMKFDRDTKNLLESNIRPDETLPWTNRRVESCFAHLKDLMKRNQNLGGQLVCDVSQAKINDLAEWLSDQVSIKVTSL